MANISSQRASSELVRFINPIPVMADTAPKFVFDFDTPGFGRQRLNPPIEEPATLARGDVITGALLATPVGDTDDLRERLLSVTPARTYGESEGLC